MKYESFNDIYDRACQRKGGEEALESLLEEPLSRAQLASISDDRFLAQFTRSIFQSGFVWRVIHNKWPSFEEVFWEFNIEKLLLMPNDMLERKSQDKRIVRNFTKVKTVIANAQMIRNVQLEHGSFARFIANWPEDDIVGLWLYLKKHGQRLGGNTGPYALRQLGKDTFILSRDIESYLRAQNIIEGGLYSKRSLDAIQLAFNHWQSESGRSLGELSRLIAFGVGENTVQA
ncbi:DNA-3-methyladenine glycosylase I [Vibrio genomosp. F10]|uniref:3-methyladenine DNA glycosylase n=1 Tax=Vibrio genomosp. F10 TaxID=723171 RepID=A0A1B9R0H3_9VIBR|nr:DNA-3-methyladenine glycosylase I [Vibrio genomosp. F10]OCH76945.1 3-methyladenine DNA glycosylase [Vibrio genomosp. F10]OEE94368.1 3-methyladenine DNA glycosylase [Vibrio genomosp. F10 str. 9ZC157]OEF05490.1 3-methyladenine DNA glycosylase [Vibrio genomosp. F10 str. 9ZB36]